MHLLWSIITTGSATLIHTMYPCNKSFGFFRKFSYSDSTIYVHCNSDNDFYLIVAMIVTGVDCTFLNDFSDFKMGVLMLSPF